MTVLFITSFPALNHESISICVSLSFILFPKYFHSMVTIFKFYPSAEGVPQTICFFPNLFLIFFLHILFPEIIMGTALCKKREKFPILLISMEFPYCPFSILVDVFLLETVA